MANQLTGEIVHISEDQIISDSFKKREFAIKIEDGQYTQEIGMQLANQKTEMIDPYNIGDTITVNYNLRGRKWQKYPSTPPRWFNTLDVWKIEGEATAVPVTVPQPQEAEKRFMSESDDLPF